MKKIKILFLVATLFTLGGCADWLDMNPRDKLSADVIFSDPQGVQLYMANLYYQLPIEDFNYCPIRLDTRSGFDYHDNGGGFVLDFLTDDALHSEWGEAPSRGWAQYHWSDAYKLINNVNILFDQIPGLTTMDQASKDQTLAEAHFLRGFAYYALAKRYGGVCLIDKTQDYDGDVDALKVPRSTEKATWDYLLKEFDLAYAGLPEDNGRRANKYMAMAMKSRAALHAGSTAKYWYDVDAEITGQAASENLIGGQEFAANADNYFQQAVNAAWEVINSGKYSLYQPTPATPEEAAKNIQDYFMNVNLGVGTESIMIKGYVLPEQKYSHNYDIWYTPNQVNVTWPHPGRFNPLEEMVDDYEVYAQPGEFVSFKTINNTATGKEDVLTEGFNAAYDYIHFENPADLFQGRDARMMASVVYPGSVYKGQTILIKGGNVWEEGGAVKSSLVGSAGEFVKGPDGNPIVAYGASSYMYGDETPSKYSGFSAAGGNYTRTGFTFKKFLMENETKTAWHQSTQDWAEIRYAEVLLNYIEAAWEKTNQDATELANARTYLNQIRRRAGHTTEVDLTWDRIKRERRVELAFENKRYWDLTRRREWTKTMGNNWYRIALIPVQDYRPGSDGKWIFVRRQCTGTGGITLRSDIYYKSIDGQGANGVVQN